MPKSSKDLELSLVDFTYKTKSLLDYKNGRKIVRNPKYTLPKDRYTSSAQIQCGSSASFVEDFSLPFHSAVSKLFTPNYIHIIDLHFLLFT